MNIAIFGVGYVGSVSAACLAEQGNTVVLVDVDPAKVDSINGGRAPIAEPGLADLIAVNVARGRLKATQDVAAAVAETELCLICVGTPSDAGGDLDLTFVRQVCGQIGAALAGINRYYSVVVRSTMLPGSMHGTVIPCLERASGLKAGEGFGVAIYPEFLRESTAIEDFHHPALILLGIHDERTRDRLRALNAPLTAPEVMTDIGTAEAVKYTNNAWHAAKVAFANEVGNICKSAGIDGHKVMEILCQDRRLNISGAYLKPGFAFGGSCLPKDLRALIALGRRNRVKTPVFESLLQANELQIERALEMVLSTGRSRVGLLGLTFKSDTDDLRESPLLALAERMVGSGLEVRIFDRNVRPANGHANGGGNGRANGPGNGAGHGPYHDPRLGRLAMCLTESLDDLYAHADVIVVGNKAPEFMDVTEQLRAGKEVIDLVRINASLTSSGGYHGICW
jgi:GDP-mannose 6-dehydrogenase